MITDDDVDIKGKFIKLRLEFINEESFKVKIFVHVTPSFGFDCDIMKFVKRDKHKYRIRDFKSLFSA